MDSRFSRTWEQVTLLKGSNQKLDNIELLKNTTSMREWEYHPECAGGFYLIRDKDIAEQYAKMITSDTGNGLPTINQYTLNLAKIHNSVKEAYFNELNKESMIYVGENILGKLPDDCPYKTTGKFPEELCHKCIHDFCDRNAEYIEAILSRADYNLDSILIELVNGAITEEEALWRINNELKANGSEIKIQIVLRDKAFEYLTFDHCYTI